MTQPIVTLAHRKPLRFWGWGYADEMLSPEEESVIRAMATGLSSSHGLEEVAPPTVDEIPLSTPRIGAPASLSAIVSHCPRSSRIRPTTAWFTPMASRTPTVRGC
jgi:alkyldihydroxyacetonephosphate synthase